MKKVLSFLVILIPLFSVSVLAETGPSAKHEHRQHKAHKHGAAKLNMAFQGREGQINLELASEGLYGFEYAPKTEADKKAQHDALAKLETNIKDMIQFEASLKCEISKLRIDVDQHEGGKHSDVDAEFKVICEKSPLKSKIVFNIQKSFPKLKDVDVQVIVDELQKSFEAKKDGAVLELKK